MSRVFRRVLLSLSCFLFLSQLSFADSLSGEKIYSHLCSSCHGFSGNGRVGLAPALRGSAIIKGDMSALINVVMNGRKDTLMVAFKKNMNDDELAVVINYIRKTFSSSVGEVSATDIALARNK